MSEGQKDRHEEMNMIKYKHYDSSYEAEALKVLIESFVNYPLFWGVFEDRFKPKKNFWTKTIGI